MKCLLVVPAWRPEDIFSKKTSVSQINYWQPVGTLYVASALMGAGHEVRFANGAFSSHEEILDLVRSYGPDAVGMYSTAFGWSRAKRTAVDIRKISPDIATFVGGPYPTAEPEACLSDCPEMDYAISGEGEDASVKLLQSLREGSSFDAVKGLTFRNDGLVVKNPPGEFIEDLDRLRFPARRLLGNSMLYMPPPATYKRKPVAVMLTSRGCNRRCVYCFQLDRERSKGIRYRSVENVLDEIEVCLDDGYREIKFIDDTLAADYDRAMRLCEGIRKRGLNFTWFASACVNQVDETLLREFRRAGCWAVLFGAESGVQKNLNAIRKGIKTEQIVQAVRAAKRAGLFVSTPFLFGIPGETYDEGLQTIDFALKLDPDVANFHAITPFPGTELYEKAHLWGTVSTELSDYTYQGAAFVPHTMSREDISRLRRTAFRRFYLRPKFLLRRIIALRKPEDFLIAVKSLRSLFWLIVKKDVFKRAGRKRD